MTTKVYTPDPTSWYKLTKLHEDGTEEVKAVGLAKWVTFPEGSVIYTYEGTSHRYWRTSLIQDIEPTGKGVKLETLNSTYVLEKVPNDERGPFLG